MKNSCRNVKRTGDATEFFPTRPDSRAAARLLRELEQIPFPSRRGSPLNQLCAAGAEYGWQQLQRTMQKSLFQQVSAKAQASLRRHLQRTLAQITAPCLGLEWKSFILAMQSLGLAEASSESTERMFLRERPSYRMGLLFRRFPVLARLWVLAIAQWCNHIGEVLQRVRKDCSASSRLFFNNCSLGRIVDIRAGILSTSWRDDSGRLSLEGSRLPSRECHCRWGVSDPGGRRRALARFASY